VVANADAVVDAIAEKNAIAMENVAVDVAKANR
jgi:hypothetical protein